MLVPSIEYLQDEGAPVAAPGLFPLQPRSLNADWIRQLLPAEMARRHLALPFQEVDGRLKVYLGDPLNREAAEELQLLSGCIVDAQPATPQVIREAIRQVYQPGRTWACIHVSEEASQPLLDFTATVLLSGPAALVRMRHCFLHEHADALYQFSLPSGSLLQDFRVEAGDRVLEGQLPGEGPAECRLLEIDAAGTVTARLSGLPGGPLWIEVSYGQLVKSDTLRLPGSCSGLTVHFETVPAGLVCNSRDLHPALQGQGLQLHRQGASDEDFLLRWTPEAGGHLFCSQGHFLLTGAGGNMTDRGLNYLPETLQTSSDGVVTGRCLSVGGLEVRGQLLHPVSSSNPALALVWAQQCLGGPQAAQVARGYSLLTPQTPFVLVDPSRPEGASLEMWEAGGLPPRAEVSEGQIHLIVDLIVSEAVKLRASHIHVEPDGRGLRIRYRVQGALHEVMSPPRSLQEPLLASIKSIAGLDLKQNQIPQSGRGSLQLDGQPWTLMIATLPTIQGEKLVIQLLPNHNLGLEQLGFRLDVQDRLKSCLSKPHGILLVTGPRRAGKGTTLAALARAAVSPDRHLLWWDERGFPALEGATHLHPSPSLRADALLSAIEEHDPEVLVWSRIHSQQLTRMVNLSARQLILTTWDQPWYPGLRGTLGANHALTVLDQRLANCLCSHCHSQGCQQCSFTGRGGQVSLAQIWEFPQGATHPSHISPSLHQQLGELVNQGRVSASESQRLSLGSSAPP